MSDTFNAANIVVLFYSENPCYTTLLPATDEKIKSLNVVIDRRTGDGGWYVTKGDTHGRWRDIGRDPVRCQNGSQWGVIGVYDRTNIQHLRNMIEDAKAAVASTDHSYS